MSKKYISDDLKEFLKSNDLLAVLEALENREDSKNYFDFSYTDKSKVSYLTQDRIPDNLSLLFDKEYRVSKAYHTKIGKLISDAVSNDVIVFASKKFFARQNSFDIILVDNICYNYLESSYSRDESGNGGSLYNSCMRYDECQDYTAIYEYFGKDVVQLAVILNADKKVLARALFWNCIDSNDNSVKYLDRVYAVNDNIGSMMYNWAEENGFLSYNKTKPELRIDVNIPDDHPLPYFDSFRYYEDGILSTESGKYCLDSTDGQCLDEMSNDFYCNNCGESVDEGDRRYSNCEDRDLCPNCSVWSDYMDDYLSESEAVYSEHSNTYICAGHDDFVYSEYHSDYLHRDDVVPIGDDFVLASEAIFDNVSEEWFLKDDYDNLIAEREASVEAIS